MQAFNSPEGYINATKTGKDGQVYLVSVKNPIQTERDSAQIQNYSAKTQYEQNQGSNQRSKRESTLRQQIGEVFSQVNQLKSTDDKFVFDKYL